MASIDISPAPHVVQTALDHCDIPLVYGDDKTIKLDPAGWDSNGNMILTPQMEALLTSVLTVAMVKHVEDTMVIPSNVAAIRRVVDELSELRMAGRSQDAEWIDELRETLTGVADNLGRTR